MSTLAASGFPGIPTYFVSTRHGRSALQPYGIEHARQAGVPRTACGQVAHEWRIFWELPFPDSASSTCKECLIAVAFSDHPDPRVLGRLRAARDEVP